MPEMNHQPDRVHPAALGGLLLALMLFLLHAFLFSHYVNDDAYITFRYSRFLSLGRGPYFNPGEHVEGYSNPLLMLLIAGAIAFGGPGAAAPTAQLIGIAAGVVAIVLVFVLCRHLRRSASVDSVSADVAGVLAAGTLAVSPAFALNSMSGLETLLYGALLIVGVTLGVLSLSRGRWLGSGIAFAAAALTRPEAAVVFAVYWCAQAFLVPPPVVSEVSAVLRKGWRSLLGHPRITGLLLDGALVTAAVAAQLVFRLLAYDGSWLPNTYYAKSGGFFGEGAWDYIDHGALVPFLGPLGALVAVAGWGLARRRVPASSTVLAVAACGALLPAVTGTDWMLGWRLLVPYLPLIAVVVSFGWIEIATRWAGRREATAALALLALLPLLWSVQEEYRSYFIADTATRGRGYENGHMALAEWLRQGEAREGDAIALMDTGIIGYLCIDQTILDITGLTDRFIAQSPGQFLKKRYDPGYVLRKRPRFMVLVLTTPGDPTQPLPSGAELKAWTDIESSFLADPDFQKEYEHHRPAPPGHETWTESLARQTGAERVFVHDNLGKYYLLTVFRRREDAAT